MSSSPFKSSLRVSYACSSVTTTSVNVAETSQPWRYSHFSKQRYACCSTLKFQLQNQFYDSPSWDGENGSPATDTAYLTGQYNSGCLAIPLSIFSSDHIYFGLFAASSISILQRLVCRLASFGPAGGYIVEPQTSQGVCISGRGCHSPHYRSMNRKTYFETVILKVEKKTLHSVALTLTLFDLVHICPVDVSL